jgi:transposase InsO family protein
MTERSFGVTRACGLVGISRSLYHYRSRRPDSGLIAAGKPTQNAYIESFNGNFRDECLNDHCFSNLAHARAVIAAWRRDYNEARPHSGIRRIPPAEFAARHRSNLNHAAELHID